LSLSLFDAFYYGVGSELEKAAAAILNQQHSTLNAATIFSHIDALYCDIDSELEEAAAAILNQLYSPRSMLFLFSSIML
jgi:hypothetical protein